MSLPILTPRLLLRRYESRDAGDLLSLVSHPSVARATPDIEATLEGATRYIDAQNELQPFENGKCFDLALEYRQDGRLIGLVSAVRRDPSLVEIGYALNVSYRGDGLATEAAAALIDHVFNELRLHRVQAVTSSWNNPSWRLMEHLGMKREAELREAARKGGQWHAVYIYGVLKSEWQSDRG